MEDADARPALICCKKLKPEFADIQKIQITSENFSLGRGLTNSVVIPFISISRNHCTFKFHNGSWSIVDNSTFGIKVNGKHLGKGSSVILSNGDILTFDPTCEFVYKFSNPEDGEYQIPKKRIKLEKTDESDNDITVNNNDIVNSMKLKFEESQCNEIEHIEQKLKNVKHMQTTSMMLHKQLNEEMDHRIKQLQNDYTSQIENLKGEKNEIERQKALLEEERDTQLATIKMQMEEKILKLTVQVRKHNETETELLKENSLLKEKLEKDREEFLAELSRENLSKQAMMEKLEARIREQEEIRMKDRQEAVELLKKEIENLNNAKEQQIKEIEEQKMQRETELRKELDTLRNNFRERAVQTEQERLKAEQQLNEQMEQMKRLNDEEKLKIEKLMKEREEIQNKLNEAQDSAAKSLEELRVKEGAGGSAQAVLCEVGELVESELQCSVCAELFVAPVTLNCSHTFCTYCITMWKRKKMDCPICRARIVSECKSLVLDSFIEKMVQSLSNEMKEKRKEILKHRQELESKMSLPTPRKRRGSSFDESSDFNDSDDFGEEEEEEELWEEDEQDVSRFFDEFGEYPYSDDDVDDQPDWW